MQDKPCRIRLEYEDFQLYVTWLTPAGEFEKRESRALHRFKPGSEPDLLFEYLVLKAKGKPVTRKALLDDGVLVSKNLDFTRVVMEQAEFDPILKKTFVVRLRPDEVKLKIHSTISELDLFKLENHLRTLRHSGSTKHGHSVHFRVPDSP